MSTQKSISRIRHVRPMLRFTLRMMSEMARGLYRFRHLPQTVTVYGSARLKPDNRYYQEALTLGQKLAEVDIEVITGGGPGIMEAANKGAHSISKRSNGCNIVLPFEQKANPYITTLFQTEYFFVRKFLLRHSSKALIAFPGGFGTMDELFESLTLIRTNSTPKIPTILVGTQYWQGLVDYLRNVQLAHGTISEEDLSQLYLTDDLDEVVQIIRASLDE